MGFYLTAKPRPSSSGAFCFIQKPSPDLFHAARVAYRLRQRPVVARSPVSRHLQKTLAAAALSGLFLWSSAASADISSWIAAGAGPAGLKLSDADWDVHPALQFDVGVGTTPDAPFIVGGFYRLTPIIGLGTDMGVLLRGATSGFQAGGFGLAVDAGGYARLWGTQSYGFTGGLTVGAPFGVTVSLTYSRGTAEAQAFSGIAAIDVLRLTVYRKSLLDVWPNPGKEARFGRAFWF